MQSDFLIVGGGIAGSLLSWELRARGKNVLLVDDGAPNAASRVCGGVINPVTGWRMVRTWMWDALEPAFTATYRGIEAATGSTILQERSILTFYPDAEGLQLLAKRSDREEAGFLHGPVAEAPWQPFFRFEFGIGEISPAWTVDVPGLLSAIRQVLHAEGRHLHTRFSFDELKMGADGVQWREQQASRVIFCRGIADAKNPWFGMLPFFGNKGEGLLATIPGLPREQVLRQGLSLVPWGTSDQWWIGTTHELRYADILPTPAFREAAEKRLRHWLRLPFAITGHLAAERPTTADRRPFVGMHPVEAKVGIFNGLGTKGCSLGPLFAAQLAAMLCGEGVIDPAVDVARFSRLLQRAPGL